MTHDEVLALVREVADPRWADPVCSMGDMVTLTLDEMIAFADRAAVEAERERIVADGWRQCAKGQRTTQFCGQLQKAVEAEREACLSACNKIATESKNYHAQGGAQACWYAIKARGGEA